MKTKPFKTKTFFIAMRVQQKDHLNILVVKFIPILRSRYFTAKDLQYIYTNDNIWNLVQNNRFSFFHIIYLFHIIITTVAEKFWSYYRWIWTKIILRYISFGTKSASNKRKDMISEFELERKFFFAVEGIDTLKRIDILLKRSPHRWEKFLWNNFRSFENLKIRRLIL